MCKIVTTKSFIERSVIIHNNKYDYSKVEYVKATEKVTIICPTHGWFNQTPNSHLNGNGCRKCMYEDAKITTKEFLDRCNKIYNFKYDYSLINFDGHTSKIDIICPIHGKFTQMAQSHLKGSACKNCGRDSTANKLKKSTDNFIKDAKNIHKDRYDYNKSIYNRNQDKLIITCRIHGDFLQSPNSHLAGHGCPKCGFINNDFNRTSWVNKGKDKIGIFYVIRCFNKNEEFYKLGRTFKSVKKRYRSRLPYEYEILQEVKSFDLSFIWDLENYFRKYVSLQSIRYTPSKPFPGSKYECFILNKC